MLVTKPRGDCGSCPSRFKSCFSGLHPAALEAIDRIRKTTHFHVGELLTAPNRDSVFCLKEGGIRREIMYGSGFKTVRLMGRGHLFQIDSLNVTKTVFIKTSEACRFDQNDLMSALAADPSIALSLWNKIKEDMHCLERRIAGLENHTVRNRVASLLMELLQEFSAHSSKGIFIDVNVDRKSLALMAGTVPETIARILTGLEKEGILNRQGRTLYITNISGLTKIASAG